MNKTKVKKIDSNIEESFKIIDEYLPSRYTAEVKKEVPDVTEESIRQVKSRRTGDIKIIAALLKVARRYETILK
ncbi:hypothetical protein [Chryseobacterium caseinilyticum]|uniref:XRE family transcriptional regulator n=1 Tax=Chryseobacterium caseinilyticum TaxID=2771428 RepID=A0ABR8Z766_9FLAO|nr:hypothetical protein [Chryseobacterium caseinilyticum]MBD8081093.1 hypothetical protein [Chryseobacterium caseinilyticum]